MICSVGDIRCFTIGSAIRGKFYTDFSGSTLRFWYSMIRQCGQTAVSAYNRSQSSQRTHSVTRILGPSMAPHSQAFWQMRQVLHSDQRLIRNTVAYESRPSVAPTGQRKRQYRLRTNRRATSSPASSVHVVVVPAGPNIQNGSTY